jgi:hypothetical protein
MRARTLAVLASLVLPMLAPTVTTASCAGFPPIGEHLAMADVVFTGTVIGLRNQDRTATFAVTEIWRGPDLLREVFVHGGPDDPNAGSSVDRTFEMGTDYLVAARIRDGELVDDACSATRPWEESLADVRPADARPPTGSEPSDDEAGLPTLPIALGALFVLLLVGSWIAFRTKG